MELKNLEQRLNGDAELAKRFLADPVGTLEAEGLALSEKAMGSLRHLARKASAEAAEVPGSSLPSSGCASVEMV